MSFTIRFLEVGCGQLVFDAVITSSQVDKRSISINVSVRLFVCLSVFGRISQKPHLQISSYFLYTLPVAVCCSSSDDNAIRYVHSVCG